jgi:hypothetical protein
MIAVASYYFRRSIREKECNRIHIDRCIYVAHVIIDHVVTINVVTLCYFSRLHSRLDLPFDTYTLHCI